MGLFCGLFFFLEVGEDASVRGRWGWEGIGGVIKGARDIFGEIGWELSCRYRYIGAKAKFGWSYMQLLIFTKA